MNQSSQDADNVSGVFPTIVNHLDLARWHIDRYDRLRASTSSRAAVVLSAGAILTARNAVVLSQLLQQTISLVSWLVVVCAAGLLVNVGLIVLALVSATGVLVSLRPSREMFPDPDLPIGLAFNASDTIQYAGEFSKFHETMRTRKTSDMLEAAHMELWIIIRQHRHRYARLRTSVRALRHAATVFLTVLTTLVIANMIARLV
jgi:hypothetical protein